MRGESGHAYPECGHFVPITKPQPMAAKKNFVLRLDEATYKALEKWASDEFRSVNGQIEYLLDQKLKEAGRLKILPITAIEKNENPKKDGE